MAIVCCGNVVDWETAGWIVHEADHFVSMRPVNLEIFVGASSQMTSADNQGPTRVTMARTIDGSPAGSYQ